MHQRAATRRHNKEYLLSRSGRAVALVLVLILLCSCTTNDTPKIAELSSEPAELATTTISPQSTPIEIATNEPKSQPLPTFTFVGQVVSNANESINIREEASILAPIIGTYPAGETAGVIEYSKDWAYIQYKDLTGYVSRAYLLILSTLNIPVPAGEWALILVNPSHYLPEDFKVSLADFEGGRVDDRILQVCEQMFSNARRDGVELSLVDAYRSFERQNELYQLKVENFEGKGYSRENAEVEAAAITARPGTSEHQTGLALDIVTPSYAKMNKGFANTKAFKWLDANAYNYGFTMRYKEDKVSVTGVIYEPWHWRFVGVKAAIDMKISGQCLEEYLYK